MAASLTSLDYAPKPSPRNQRRFRRALKWAAVAAVLGAVAWGGISLWPRAKLLYWQRQCMAYSLAPNVVVYDENASTAPALAKRAEMQAAPLPGWYGTMSYAKPRCYEQMFASVGSSRTRYFPPAPVFMHARDGGSGPRLVIVAVDIVWRDKLSVGKYGGMTFSVMSPASWKSDPRSFSVAWRPPEISSPREAGKLRVYAGQADPVDASHFTIDCDTSTGRRTIDFWLEKDDRLKCEVRRSPTTASAP